mmetsp:Transcript_15565/g.22558  ORF Transcript_15565/g.22558 Transcript_15565/m.22558 type:complete len:97 (+) Transcript_15565:174-464(+)
MNAHIIYIVNICSTKAKIEFKVILINKIHSQKSLQQGHDSLEVQINHPLTKLQFVPRSQQASRVSGSVAQPPSEVSRCDVSISVRNDLRSVFQEFC